jgi:hypothetical protein
MARRNALAAELVSLIGPAATLVQANDGWPSVVDVKIGDGQTMRIAAHLSNISDMARHGPAQPIASRPHELRFQNPPSRKPVVQPAGTTVLLIGMLPSIGGDPPAIVVPTYPRLGRAKRFTVVFPGGLAYAGAHSGWSVYTSTDGDVIHGLVPALLPTLLEARRLGVTLSASSVATAADASGLLSSGDDATKERARIATTRLARDAKFRQRVLDAHGEECALCGISVKTLLHAAHLLPASLPKSADVAENGVPICLNHHAAFDAHHIHIDPATRAVRISPTLTQIAQSDPGLASLLTATRSQLSVPAGVAPHEVGKWLSRRYAAYPREYLWV